MQFADVVRNRRMTRAFSIQAVDPEIILNIVDLASRAPSAGKTQGWHVVVLSGEDVTKFWDDTLAQDKRENFRWKGLLEAPVVALVLADPQAYVDRYAQDDKAHTGLGTSIEAWPTAYWTVDASFAAMTMLLALQDAGLGGLFFGVFFGEQQLRKRLMIPTDLQLIGAIALGWPSASSGDGDGRGISASRARRSPEEIIHYGHW